MLRAVGVYNGNAGRQNFGKLNAFFGVLLDYFNRNTRAVESFCKVVCRARAAEYHYAARVLLRKAQAFQELLRFLRRGGQAYLVAAFQYEIAVRDEHISAALNHAHQEGAFVFSAQLAQLLSVKRRAGLYAKLRHFKAVARKGFYFDGGRQIEHIEKLARRDGIGVYDHRKLHVFANKALFLVVIFRLAYSRNRVLRAEFSCEEAAYHIKLVGIGHGDKDVRLVRIRLRKRFVCSRTARNAPHIEGRRGFFDYRLRDVHGGYVVSLA